MAEKRKKHRYSLVPSFPKVYIMEDSETKDATHASFFFPPSANGHTESEGSYYGTISYNCQFNSLKCHVIKFEKSYVYQNKRKVHTLHQF